MKKTELFILLASFGFTAVISSLFGAAGRVIGGTFWGWFFVTMLVQVILFLVWNSLLIQRDRAQQTQLDIQELEALSKFMVNMACAYCGRAHTIPIRLNTKNTFKCEGCNQVNGVFMQFSATTLTTPIESVKIPLPDSENVEIKVRQ